MIFAQVQEGQHNMRRRQRVPRGGVPQNRKRCGRRRSADSVLIPLSHLALGQLGTVVRITPGLRSPKKFSDIGLVEGTQVVLEGYAPFGGLLRIRLLDCCMSLHRDEAVHILVRVDR